MSDVARTSEHASVRTQPASGARYLARQSFRTALGRTIAYLLLTLGGVLMFIPFLWLVSSSLKDASDVYRYPPIWLPQPPQWHNYVDVMTQLPFALYTRNTLIITVSALIGQVLTSSVSAYAFARLRWRARDLIFSIILATMMLPYAVTLIPVYILFRSLHWTDTFLPLIVPYWFGGGAFNIFLLRQFFLTIPLELEDAGRIDGAGSWTIFWQIILPLAKPALAVVAILGFQGHWNDFLGPLIYLDTNAKWTLAIGLNSLQGLQWGRDTTNLVMAVSVMMIAPIIVLFFLAQRTFIQGIVLTGIKG
jgi:multiple sugar transport system permease protein